MNKKIRMLASLAVVTFLMSCATYPAIDDRLEEDLVDITKYDPATVFDQFKTFSIVDSLALINEGDTIRILDSQAQALLNRIIMNMQSRGYTLVNRKAGNPDLGINAGVVKQAIVYDYPGWYWDYGWYDPAFWGYYGKPYWYPYNPPAVSTYNTGTVIIDMVDLKNAGKHNNKLYIVWVAVIRGLMTGSHSTQDVLDNVDQCFNQTPQITAN